MSYFDRLLHTEMINRFFILRSEVIHGSLILPSAKLDSELFHRWFPKCSFGLCIPNFPEIDPFVLWLFLAEREPSKQESE